MKNVASILILLLAQALPYDSPAIAQGKKSDSQTGRTLVLFVDGGRFLLPIIESKLRDLTNSSSGETLFEKVLSLKRLEDDDKLKGGVRELVSYYSRKPDILHLSDKAKRIGDLIGKELTSINSFLRVDILPLQNLLEYQFTYYDSLRADNSTQMVSLLENPTGTRALSIIVNPASAQYDDEIATAVRRLFPESNALPTVRVLANGVRVVDSETRYFGIGDTVVIDCYETFDKDTPKSKLHFVWR